MKELEIIETDLDFQYELCERDETDMIVLHHTGSGYDTDTDAESIHKYHQSIGWAGIGYHFVVRKDGTIERGRPEEMIGSHCYGENDHTLGIHLSGDFRYAEPTQEQIDSCALLIAHLCEDYDIPIDRDHIVGHQELNDDTTCPGDNLQELLDDETITDRAAQYANGDIDENEADGEGEEEDIEKIAILARKYESNDDPACVSSGAGDLGGVSYGMYQFATNNGSVNNFVEWLCNYPDEAYANYGKVLSEHEAGSVGFSEKWSEIGTIDPGGFGRLQDEYIKTMYYDKAVTMLLKKHYRVSKHTTAMKAVVLSRAVQHGPAGCAELFDYALNRIKKSDEWNLSYVDDAHFDRDMISAIYEALVYECDCATPDQNGVWHSPEGFCNGSKTVLSGLRFRFIREKSDALLLLTREEN